MRQILTLFIFLVLVLNVNAQDPHFSQFFASPLTLNPAFTGKIDGDFRLAGNYRNQWPTINRAYNTTTFSADFPVFKNSIAANDIWGLGVMGYSDQSANSAVKFNYLTLSTAFHKGLDEEGYTQLGAAFQGSYANMLIDVTNLHFEDMLTSNGWTGSTSETFSNSISSRYFDLNAGLLFTTSSNDQNNLYAGVSMYHINRPKQQFSNTFFLLNSRTTFHAGGYFPVGQTSTLHLSGLHSSQAKTNETVVGGALQLPFGADGQNTPSSLYVGSWFRLKDAIIPYVGLEFNNVRIGATYDITMSTLRTASNNRGGMEISLIYTKRRSDVKGLPCPKF